MSRRALYAGGLVIAVFLLGSCDSRESGGGARSHSAGPSLLLITLDTTRADRLGCYGYAKGETPALDALSAAGVRFDQALCQVPLTLPSHASLLTGTYPPTNGIRINAAAVLGPDVPTLAEMCKSHGYRTGAFVSAWVLDSAFGLQRGFDRYDDVESDDAGEALKPTRPADEVCASALAWLDEDSQAPFFAWVHFFDPHTPYTPPPAFRERLPDPYDGEIAFMDSQVARLMEWLERKGLRERTLVVVAGDHGEAFEEHGEIEHGFFLYNTTMQVPLIFSHPTCLPQGKVVSAGVGLIDVLPTILDLMGWEVSPQTQGHTVRPAIETDVLAFLPTYGECEYARMSFGWASLRSYTTERWKYIDAPRPELYDRVADPEENTNVIDQHADVASRLQSELADLLAGMLRRDAASMVLDDDALRALESLGYVRPSAAAASDTDEPRADPKDRLPVYRGMLHAMNLIQQRNHAEALRLVEPLAAQSPESDVLRAILGELYFKFGRLEDAEREYKASLRVAPTDPLKLCRLGDALYAQRKIAEALQCYQRAVASFADYGQAHSRLGMVYAQRREFSQAHQHLRRYLELSPDSPNAMTNLANILPHLGRREEAIGLLRKALQREPAYAEAHRALWRMLLESRRRAEAVDALRAACKALPDDWSLKRNLAMVLATTPRADAHTAQEALQLARQCCEADAELPENFDALAMAYAAARDPARAIEAAQRALSLAQRQGKAQLASQIAARLRAYQSGRSP